jgi:PBP4 family serine-type D-alanyl-D-alanine carboxypeptidase
VRVRNVLAVAGLVLAGIGAAPRDSTLSAAIEQIVDTSQYSRTFFGAAVYDLDRKRMLYARNARRLFIPASTTKLMTEGTALGVLGPNFRFTTPVYRTGPVQDGTLEGDLVLVASGDPNISQRVQPNDTLAFEDYDHAYDGSPQTKAVPGDPLLVLRDLARQVAAHGIRSVTGRVIVDVTLFPDGGPEGGTGTDVSPMILNDNLVDLIVAPGKRPGDPVSIESISPQTPYAQFVNEATTVARGDDTLSMKDSDDGRGGRIVTISGSVKAGDPPTLYAYRIPNPARFTENAFTLALRQTGVQIADPPIDPPFDRAKYAFAYVPQNLVAQHVSPPLREETKVTLKVSDNLHAAAMPYLLGVYGAHVTGDDALQAGFDVENRFLANAGLNMAGAAQSDGEGAQDVFAPSFVVSYLVWARTQPWFDDFYGALPILGVDGTLVDVERTAPARGKVHAKTGTDGFANLLSHGFVFDKGLAGYVTTRSGKHVAFCLYINNVQLGHGVDGEAILGGLLGKIANAIYLHG